MTAANPLLAAGKFSRKISCRRMSAALLQLPKD
jgi:hypothetical protein